jgi:hypothetical protein
MSSQPDHGDAQAPVAEHQLDTGASTVMEPPAVATQPAATPQPVNGVAADYVGYVYSQVAGQFTHAITPLTVITFMRVTMDAVEHIKNATGTQKREIVIAVLEMAVKQIDNESTRSAVSTALDMLGPGMIDFAVLSANGGVDFGHAVSTGCGMLPCFK